MSKQIYWACDFFDLFSVHLPADFTSTELRSFTSSMRTSFSIPVTDWDWTRINLIKDMFQLVIFVAVVAFPSRFAEDISFAVTIVSQRILKKKMQKIEIYANFIVGRRFRQLFNNSFKADNESLQFTNMKSSKHFKGHFCAPSMDEKALGVRACPRERVSVCMPCRSACVRLI